MKKTLIYLFLFISMAAMATTPTYYPYQEGDGAYILRYTINSDSLSVTCHGFSGEPSNTNSDLVIPAEVTLNEADYKVTHIGENAFKNCSTIVGNLVIGENVTTIRTEAFKDCTGLIGNLTLGSNVDSIGKRVFSHCIGFNGNLTISENLTEIPNYAFFECENLVGNLTIPNKVTFIGVSAFENCFDLDGNITISTDLETISERAFSGCTSLVGDLTIPDKVKNIGLRAFGLCSGLTGTLYMGSGVENIDQYAFNDCDGFSAIKCKLETPPTTHSDAFYSMIFSTPITVPTSDAVSAYQTADGWSNFTNYTFGNYVITFNANEGLGDMDSQWIDVDDPTQNISINTFTRVGYQFAGWATTATGGVAYEDEQSYTATDDIELFAVWTEDISSKLENSQLQNPFTRIGNEILFAESCEIEVYGTSGALIFSGITTNYTLPNSSGIYIIKVNNKYYKTLK